MAIKSFCFFEINDSLLPRKKFNPLTEKLKPVGQWKVANFTRVNCQYLAQIVSYLEDSSFRIIFKTKGMLLTAKSFCFFEINTRSLPLENYNFLKQKLKPVQQWKVAYVTRVNCQYLASWNSKLSRRLILPYHFKMKGMLLTAKSFCAFVINACSLPGKNVNFLTQKLKPVEQWRVIFVTQVICQYFAGILSYLEDSLSVSF